MTVAAEDALGHIDAFNQDAIYLSDLYSNGDSPLNGTLSETAIAGVATFTGLTQNLATEDTSDGPDVLYAVDYNYSIGTQLPATRHDSSSDPNVPQTASNAFIITAGPAAQLAISGPTDNNNRDWILANDPLTAQVKVEDALGNVLTSYSGNFSLALGPNSTNAILGGTTTVAASQGIANFDDFSISATGNEFTLVATGIPNISGSTNPFPVLDQLVFITQPPSSMLAGSTFTVAVAAEDGAGNVDPSFTGTVTLHDSYGVLNGVLSVDAVNGMATFSGISPDGASAFYGQVTSDTLFAATIGAVGSASNSFTITYDTLEFVTQPPSTVTAGAAIYRRGRRP